MNSIKTKLLLKAFAIIMLCLTLFSNMFLIFRKHTVFAADVSIMADDPESSIYGFAIDNDYFDVNWTQKTFSVNYNGAYCGDVTLYLGGVKMKEALDNGKYGYGILVYAIMTPRAFTLTADGKSHTYRGRSRYLTMNSSMGSNQTLLFETPENVAGSSQYSVGLNIGVAASGLSGRISASTSITANALKIINSADVINGLYSVKYQYDRHIWPWEWERTYYCWNQSVQRAAFFFSASSGSLSSKAVTFEGTFAIDDGEIGMWNLEMGYEVTTTRTYSVLF